MAHVHRGSEDKVLRIAQQCSGQVITQPWRDGRGVSRVMEQWMTRDRRRKAEIRTQQAATGAPYSVARRAITRPDLHQILQEHPRLNDFGIGVFDGRRKTREQRQDELAAGRARLADQEDVVLETVDWLRENITPIQTPTVSSYRIKHVMERATGTYNSNGELIAAALIAGYSFKYDEPNVLLGMSARDIRRIELARQSG